MTNPTLHIQHSALRTPVMLGTAGHVDHGKTALVKMLTGCNTDRLAEEQRRGLTIELGYAPCRMADDRIVGVVDVPGHVDFIRNMVAGAHGIDVVIFVVAANDGVMPQTREHLDILTLMGVRHGVIALTKIDMVDAEMLALAEDDVRRFVQSTFLEAADLCPVSNVTGEGYDAFFNALNAAVDRCAPRPTGGLFRVWIDDVFTSRGFGTVVTGIPSAGATRVGERLRVLPGGDSARVRQMEVYGQQAESGRAGECLAVNVTDIDAAALRRGRVLCAGDSLRAVTMAEAELRLLPAVSRPLKDYAEVHLHVGTAAVMAHLAVLDDRQLQPGRTHLVQLRLAEPLGLAPGDRFVIRAGVAGMAGGHLTTIGGGRVLGVSDLRLRRNRPWTLEMLAARAVALDAPAAWCAQMLTEAGGAISPAELARRGLLPEAQAATLLAEIPEAVAVGSQYVHRAVVKGVGTRLRAVLERFHAENGLRLGMEEAMLLEAVGPDRPTFGLALAGELDTGAVERRGTVLALRGHGPKITEAEATVLASMEEAFRAAGLAPPSIEDAAAVYSLAADRLRKLLRLLTDAGALVAVAPGLLMHREAVAQARQTALDLFARGPSFTTMEFRDALGVSRKYAVPLLDYLDGQRVTARHGNRRTPGAMAQRAAKMYNHAVPQPPDQ